MYLPTYLWALGRMHFERDSVFVCFIFLFTLISIVSVDD